MSIRRKTKIGVLALQGAFELHKPHVEALNARYVEVVESRDFSDIDALILPGGESGAMLKLMDTVGISRDLSDCLRSKPVWGICAGAILLAKSVKNPSQKSFGAIDIEIERNSYGRQLDSFEDLVSDYQVSYIRAPKILNVGIGVNVRSARNGSPTWAESGRIFVTTFHPETNVAAPSPWHERLLEQV